MTAREIKRRIPRKAAVATGLMAVLLAVGSALAFHEGTVAIELDGNVANGAAAGVDWGDLFDGDGNDTGTVDVLGDAGNDVDRDFKVDFEPGASGPDESYHEPSNKDNQPIFATGGANVWGCRSVANATDKDDILNAYAIAYTGQGEDNGDLILSFGVERYDDSGTAYLGFWVFQKDVTCNLATNKFEGAKTDGDILLLINFSNGGDNVSILANAWHPGTPANSADGFFTVIGAGGPCSSAGDAGLDMCAITNGTGVDQIVATPWDTEDKPKPFIHGPDPVNELEPPEFVEGAINLTEAFDAIGQDPPACFGSFMAETRSSDTLSATLKDFALGDLNTCDAKISITPTQTNRVGTPHTFVVDVDQTTGGGFEPALVGDVTWTLVGANGIPADASSTFSDTASTCDNDLDGVAGPPEDNLDEDGQCTIVVTSNLTGTITANATVEVNLGGGSKLTRTTDATGDNTGPAVKTYVDAFITVGADDTNEVNQSHTFTVHVEGDNGGPGGMVDYAGAFPAITFPGGAPGTVNATDCTVNGTDSNGDCTVVVNSAVTGSFDVHASASVTLAALTFSVETDGLGTNSGDATKTYVDANIAITGDGTNEVGQPHTFTVEVNQDLGLGGGYVNATYGDVTVTLTDSNGAVNVIDAAASSCDDDLDPGAGEDNLDATGQCLIVFTSLTAGQVKGDATVTIPAAVFGTATDVVRDTSSATAGIGAGTGGSNTDAVKTFVDAYITIDPDDTNSIEEDHTFTVAVYQNDGLGAAEGDLVDGFRAATNGHVDVLLTDTLGADSVVDATASSCDNAGQNLTAGTCVTVFSSDSAGTVTGRARVNLTVGGETLARRTDGVGSNSNDAVKVFVDGSLTWLKHDGDDVLLGGATFEVCRLSRLNSNTGLYEPEDVDDILSGNQPYCFTVFDADDGTATAPDTDVTGGEIVVIDLVLGQYTVRETIPPTGYHIATPPGAGPFNFPDMTIDPDLFDVHMKDGFTGAPPVANPLAFVNIRAYRIIVITCDDITDTLVVSTVTFDSVDYDSMSATELAAWNLAYTQTLTEAQICGSDTTPSLGGAASFGDLEAGTYDIRVKVPKAI